MKEAINIVITDDETLFRQGVAFILSRHEHINIMFQAEDGQELIDELRKADEIPDMVLLDLKMPKLNGVETAKILRSEFPSIKIVALTSYFSKPFIVNMINIGAVAYLAKNATPLEMITTIDEAHKNGFYYNPEVMKIIHQGVIGNKKVSKKSSFDSNYLTKREKEILKLICEQQTTNEIAEKLFISPRTVEGHRNNLLLKTESKNIAGLVLYAIENKLLSLVNVNDVI